MVSLRRVLQSSCTARKRFESISTRSSLLGQEECTLPPQSQVLGSFLLQNLSVLNLTDSTSSRRRPGALLAAAWASLLYLGVDGYTESCREIVGAAQKIANGIRKDFPELYILGNPLVSVIAFGSRTEGKGNGRGSVPVYEVGDRMDKLGWHRAFLLFSLFSSICCHFSKTKTS